MPETIVDVQIAYVHGASSRDGEDPRTTPAEAVAARGDKDARVRGSAER